MADCQSKSTLRVAAEVFANANDNVRYFPGYEAVVYESRQPFRDDGRHVNTAAIDRVMNLFRETFCVEN